MSSALGFLVLVAVASMAHGATYTITVGSPTNTFTPSELIIQSGDSVAFVWSGGTHSVLPVANVINWEACDPTRGVDSNPFGFPGFARQSEGQRDFTFVGQGTLFYICGVSDHCVVDEMRGTITVVAANSSTPTTTTTGTSGGAVITGTPGCVSTAVPKDLCYLASYKENGIGAFCGQCLDEDGKRTVYYCGAASTCVPSGLEGAAGTCSIPHVDLSVGEPCTPGSTRNICEEAPLTIKCIENARGDTVCGGDKVFAPGEQCPSDDPVLREGHGCALGDCTNGVCEHAAEGESCATLLCGAADFCNAQQVCQQRYAVGAPCDRTGVADEFSGCSQKAECVRGTCVPLYSAAEGELCGDATFSAGDVCEKGLRCDDKNNGTNGFRCISLSKEGQRCTVGDPDNGGCGLYYRCLCDRSVGHGRCIGTQNRIGPQYRRAFDCVVDNGCYVGLNLFPGGCSYEHCLTLVEDLLAEIDDAINEVATLLNDPTLAARQESDASALSVLPATFLVAVALLVLAMVT